MKRRLHGEYDLSEVVDVTTRKQVRVVTARIGTYLFELTPSRGVVQVLETLYQEEEKKLRRYLGFLPSVTDS